MAIKNTLLIPEILKKANNTKGRDERIKVLRDNESWALKDVLRVMFDQDIVSLLPEGAPPYTADDAPKGHSKSSLYKQHKQFRYFFKGGAKLPMFKREKLFIDLLESVHPTEAELVIAAKDKEKPYRHITKSLVMDAFPDLIKK